MSDKHANDIVRAKQLELSTGAKLLNLPSTKPVPLFGDYARDDYMPWHAQQYPDSHYRIKQIIEQHLLPEFEFVALDMIEPKAVEHYKQQRRFAKMKAHTIAKELRTLKAVINRAVEAKIVAESPIATVLPPQINDSKQHAFFEPEQLQALYAACARVVNNGRGPQPDPMHAAIWKLYANTGMRRGEGMQLRKAQIDRRENEFVINSTGEERTKSGEKRRVPITDGAREALEALAHVPGPYVLPRYELPSVSRFCAKDLKAAGLPGSLHTLRHTYISLLMRDRPDISVRTIQLWAGHAKIETTEGYAYLRDKRAELVRAINW